MKKLIYLAPIILAVLLTGCGDRLTEQQMYECAIQQKVSCP